MTVGDCDKKSCAHTPDNLERKHLEKHSAYRDWIERQHTITRKDLTCTSAGAAPGTADVLQEHSRGAGVLVAHLS